MTADNVSPYALLNHFERVIVGKREPLTIMLAALVADGHVLFEDVPGTAKTLAARHLRTASVTKGTPPSSRRFFCFNRRLPMRAGIIAIVVGDGITSFPSPASGP